MQIHEAIVCWPITSFLGAKNERKTGKTQDNFLSPHNYFTTYHHTYLSTHTCTYRTVTCISYQYLKVTERNEDGHKVKSPNLTSNRPNPLPHHLPLQPRQPCPPYSCTISSNDHTILLSPNLFLYLHPICPRPRLHQSRPINRRMYPRMVQV
jgi:hypothetical protein